MLKQMYYRGKFNFHQNCSLIHHVLAGETIDGYPVIIFPRDPSKVLAGKEYEFLATPTRRATYTIENAGRKTVYRVAHATDMRRTDNSEGDFIDTIMHRTCGKNEKPTIGAALPGDTFARLAALKDTLQKTS